MTTQPPKIVLYIDHAPKLGGATQALLHLLSRRDELGATPIVVCPAGSQIADYYRRENIRVETVPMPWFTKQAGMLMILAYLFRSLYFACFVIKLIYKNNVSLIHANGFISALYAVLPAKFTRRPLLWHMNDILEPGWINKIFVRIAALGSRRIVCVSEAVKTGLSSFGVPGSKCLVIYNPAPSPGKEKPVADAMMRKEFGIPDGAEIVGMIGNISKLKGQMQFVHAARVLRNAFPMAKFLVIGQVIHEQDNGYAEHVKNFVRENDLEGSVLFTGFIRMDIRNAIRMMDVLVHPPVMPDSFPLVLLEAMGEGKPIVATIMGGIPEGVVDGLNGFLVPPGDSVALANAIGRLLGDGKLRAAMGEAGRMMGHTKFGSDSYFQRMKAVYTELSL